MAMNQTANGLDAIAGGYAAALVTAAVGLV